MMGTVFKRIGAYEIHDEIGRGGMASVLLATDTRTSQQVALRLVSTREAPDVLDAEKWGAELQEQFCRISSFVPQVYERGSSDSYFYVAMEYLDGENLSDAIRRGPLGPERGSAVAVELCRFLEDARRFTGVANGREIQHLLHGDLTPANVRITSDGRIKVVDFGIAKALSLSRKVTRNDFGVVAYLSPERLESGGDMDATDGFWAVGVMLYEMVGGQPPFRAASTRRLEELIRSRHPPASLNGRCPVGLQAVLGKLLGKDPADRYDSAQAIREDLERFRSGVKTLAEEEGWPARAADEPATRRTRPAAEPLDETTRRTRPAGSPLPVPSVAEAKAAVPEGQPLSTRPVSPKRRLRKALRIALLLIAIATVVKEIRVAVSASRMADRVPMQELDTLPEAWSQYQALSQRSLGVGTVSLERSLVAHTLTLTDRVISKYRVGVSTVWEPEWRMARDALARAVAVAPDRTTLRASLRYCEGHLHRINGDARKRKNEIAAAQLEFDGAVTAFREAAQLRTDWPDPFLGLARTFISSLTDVDRGADALSQAERRGHKPGERETLQLAEGYRERGNSLARSARQLAGMPQEESHLVRAVGAYEQALALCSKIAGQGDATRQVRLTQRGLERVRQRLNELSQLKPWA
jgi:tRNA A-37 threonylcarbamoyl transferase component Bud32